MTEMKSLKEKKSAPKTKASLVAAEAPSAAATGKAAAEKKVRRTQEDRSREARGKILAATIDVLTGSGYGGLTTKEVATQAGISNGALMHHYANKAELVVAATAAVYEEWSRRGQSLAASASALENPVEGFMNDCMERLFRLAFHCRA